MHNARGACTTASTGRWCCRIVGWHTAARAHWKEAQTRHVLRLSHTMRYGVILYATPIIPIHPKALAATGQAA
ncbi:MAG: hypothetical protein OJF49_000508 [Ktedonobacterales bacterium]|nr:MAG: hypothetical protein OJF49_000508 [Ktedonobacterales bacterium]